MIIIELCRLLSQSLLHIQHMHHLKRQLSFPLFRSVRGRGGPRLLSVHGQLDVALLLVLQ